MTDKPTIAELKETLTRREGMLSAKDWTWEPHDRRVIEASIADLKRDIKELEKPA